jgi:hypothetical protein
MKRLAKPIIAGMFVAFVLTDFGVKSSYAEEGKSSDSVALKSLGGEVQKSFFLGLSAGFPQLAGVRGDWAFTKSGDLRPDFLFTAEGGMTMGYYINVGVEKRLGEAPIYAGVGYNHNLVFIGGSAGGMAWGGHSNLDAMLVSVSYRTSYLRPSAWCFSLGALISPDIGEVPVFPLLKVSLMRTN